MTIAACYLTPEGLVLGADSTTTMQQPGENDHHCNFGQKIFEIGENSTLGITMWGLGGLGSLSYRTMIANLSDDIKARAPSSVLEVVQRWTDGFWRQYSSVFAGEMARLADLRRISPRSDAEEEELRQLCQLSGGFCIGGRVESDRAPYAFEVVYGPWMAGPEPPRPIEYCVPRFWGCNNLIYRLLFGIDDGIFQAIIGSGKWNGTPDELVALAQPHFLSVPKNLPLREAVDWIFSSIYITIKAFKFSWLVPVCGGQIEVAAITTDRAFRWVTHKSLSEAIEQSYPAQRSP